MPNKAQFQKFYESHIDKVFRFVYFRCGDREEAEDLVSEIFIKALDHFDKYDESLSKTAWIMTITKNHLANHWRDKKPTSSVDAMLENEEVQSDAQWLRHGLQMMQKDESKRQVYEILAKISQEDAEIVTFHYLIGYTYAEIAAIKQMNEGAVKVAAHRAIKKLRELI